MFRVGSRYLLSLGILAIAIALTGTARAQSDEKNAAASDPNSNPAKSSATVTSTPAVQAQQPSDAVDPLKRPPTKEQKKQQKKNLNIELSKTYKKLSLIHI